MPIIISQNQSKDTQLVSQLQQKIKLFVSADSKIEHFAMLEQFVIKIVTINVNVITQPNSFVENLYNLILEFNSIAHLEEITTICKKIIVSTFFKIIDIFSNRLRKSVVLNTITKIIKNSSLINKKQQKKKHSIYQWGFQTKITPTTFYPQLIKTIIKQLQINIKIIWNLQLIDMIDYIDFINNLTASAQHQHQSKLLIQNIASQINALFKSGRQDLIKYADKNNIQKLREMLDRKMRKQKVFDRIILQNGLNLSYSLLTSQYPANKLAGFKLLDKLIFQYSYFSNTQKCDMLISWLNNNEIFKMILSKKITFDMLQNAQYIFRVFEKCYPSQIQKIQYIISLMKIKPQNYKIINFINKQLNQYHLNIKSKEIIYNYFISLDNYQQFKPGYFDVLVNLTYRYQENIINQRVYFLFCRIMEQCYDKWSDLTKARAQSTMRQLITRFYSNFKGKSNEVKTTAIKELVIYLFKEVTNVRIIIFKWTFMKQKFGNLLSNNPLQAIFSQLIPKEQILQRIFLFLQKNQQKDIKQRQFMQVIKFLSSKVIQKQDFIINHIEILTKYTQIYKDILSQSGHSQLQSLLNRIYQIFLKNQIKIQFKVLQLAFQKYNYDSFTQNYKEFSLYQYKNEEKVLKVCPKQLKYYDKLIDLMVQTNDLTLKNQITRYIVSLYINHKNFKFSNGEESLVQFMTEIIDNVQTDVELMKNHEKKSQNQADVYVDLLLLQKCIQFTDILGCGIYPPHKSLVATSSIYMVILNNITFGDDVQKIVQHDFPSNMILFDVLTYIGHAFKCGPEEIILHQGQRLLHPIYNSRCLQDLNLNNLQIIAQKNLANHIQTPQLKGQTERQINPIIIKAIREVFNRFAYEGKMSLIQCTNYVRHSTGSQCLSNDRRVREIMQESNKDNDGIIVVQDFIKYHQRNFNNFPYHFKEQIIKSFFNLRYRKNFTMYNVPLDISQKYYVMMRYKISKSNQIYKLLFQLTQSDNPIFSSKAKELLLLLPSYNSQQNLINQPLNFNQLSQFIIYYRLISILNILSSQNNTNLEDRMKNIQRFSENKNNQIIFGLIKEYNFKKQKSQYGQKCFLICLKILRSLINVQYLSKLDLQSFSVNNFTIPNIPSTTFFAEQAQKALNSRNILNFQTLLVLQLTQNQINIQQIVQYCFHQQQQVRKISSAFLFILSTLRKTSLNLFNKPIPQTNNEQWFNLLCGIISNNIIQNYELLQKQSLNMLSKRKQDTSNDYDNLMNGYLRILQKLLVKTTIHQGQIQFILKNLLQNTLSQKNRAIIYEIIKKINIDISISYFDDMLTNIYPSNQCQIRHKYSGIKNLGCICYINSILQQLFTIDKFKNMILTKNIPKDCDKSQLNGKIIVDDFMYQLQKLYYYLQYGRKKYYIPQQFCFSLKDFDGKPINVAIQQDSHEFLNNLIQKSQKSFKQQNKLLNLQQIFLIKTLVQIQCEICLNKISRIQNNYNLMIQVKDHDTLFDSLKKYTQKQHISDYFCQKCNKKVNKICKNTYLHHLPEVIILNLQRIVYDKYKNQRIKVHSKLTFPNQINFQQFIKNDQMKLQCTYNLKGVVIHSGNSQGGHYYSLIKTSKYGWLKFNDQSVTPFDQKQIQRQCFGGIQTSKDYIDVNYSSSAYILFYQKHTNNNQNQNIAQNHQIELQNQFTLQVEHQNIKLFKQLQIHQSSFFNAIINSYQHIKIHNIQEYMGKNQFYCDYDNIEPQNRERLSRMRQIIQKALSFLTVFTDIKAEVKIRIGHIMMQLLFCLPQDNVAYLKELNIQTYIQNMITLQDPNYRQVLSSILSSSIINYTSFTNFTFQNNFIQPDFLIEKLDIVMNILQSKIMYANMTKLDGYFNFWKKIMKFPHVDFIQYMNDKYYFFKILDMIFGKESIYQKHHNFAHNLPIALIENLSSHLEIFIQRKTNCSQQRQKMSDSSFKIIKTTNLQKTILLNPNFYRRLFKMSYINEAFIKFINFYSFNDESFTIMIMEIYLHYLNKRQTIEKLSIFVQGLSSFLKLNDNVKNLRFSGIFGFPQAQDVDQNFCFQKCTNEIVVHYVSGSKYKKRNDMNDKKPLLQILYDSQKYVGRIIQIIQFLQTILQLSCQSADIFTYIIGLPTPTYFIKHYYQWIPQIINRILNAKDFYLENKIQKIQILRVYYSQIQQKIKKIQHKLPIQKYIIGRNESTLLMDQQKNSQFDMQLTKFSTYVLDNLPQAYEENKSLPRKQFPFYSSFPMKNQDKANIFIKSKSNKLSLPKQLAKKYQIPCKFTIYNIKGQIFTPLIFKFTIKDFKYDILLDQGKFDLNFPYKDEGKIQDHILIRKYINEKAQDCQQQVIKAFNIQKQKQKSSTMMQQQKTNNDKQNDNINLNDKFICQSCTFINQITNQTCQMCNKSLF